MYCSAGKQSILGNGNGLIQKQLIYCSRWEMKSCIQLLLVPFIT